MAALVLKAPLHFSRTLIALIFFDLRGLSFYSLLWRFSCSIYSSKHELFRTRKTGKNLLAACYLKHFLVLNSFQFVFPAFRCLQPPPLRNQWLIIPDCWLFGGGGSHSVARWGDTYGWASKNPLRPFLASQRIFRREHLCCSLRDRNVGLALGQQI